MTRTDLNSYKKILTTQVERIEAERKGLRDGAMQSVGGDRGVALADTSATSSDPGTATSEKFVALSLLNTEGELLAESRAALERIEQGTFGKCERCNLPIAKARLEAVPYARHCIACVRVLEAEAGMTE